MKAIKDRAAPMCSITAARLAGRPDITTRQFTNPSRGHHAANYAQLVARYATPEEAENSHEALTKQARACPAKRHVPRKQLPGNRFTFEHDDTWALSEEEIAKWAHLRGFEKHVVPPSQSRLNVFYFAYDYAQHGNVVIATVYWERREPKQSGDPIAKRATEVLTMQLQKIG